MKGDEEMAGINFIGSYSGIDKTTIDQLMQAEKMPLVQLSNKKTDLTAKQNAWKDINTRLSSLFDKLKTLQSNETFTSKTSKSTNDEIVTMVASKNAIEGTYNVHVQQLATNSNIISDKVLSEGQDISTSLNIEGSFVIQNKEGTKTTINVAEEDSLKSIVSKINATTKDKTVDGVKTEGTGINASIIDGRLILTDEKTGERNIGLTDETGDIFSELKLDPASVNMGKKSIFTINDIEISRDKNTITDAVEGVTINLNKEHQAGQYEKLNISLDTSKLTKAVQDFVDQYNSTMTFIEDKLAAGDPEVAGSKGTLAGDSSLMRLHSSLRNMVTSTISNKDTSIKDISQLGVTTIDKFGQLQFDSSKLTEALGKDSQNVINFFSGKDTNDKEIGFSPRLKEYVDSFVSKSNGVIKGKTESFDRSLKDLNSQIDSFNARMVKKEAYYIKMFSALDVAMMQSESQMSWLEGQVSAMNAQNK